MAFGEPLQPQRRVKPGPFRAQHRNCIALLADLRVQPLHPLDAGRRFHLDAIDIGSRKDQHADDEEVDDPHDQPPLMTPASVGQAGNLPSSCGGAAVRSAARSFADRARGLAAACATSGRCRDPLLALPRSTRKFLTMRSSSEWKDTTTSRPPGFSTRSAADSARCSSSSSWLTKILKPWNV